jgi:UDPglucose--hexose-1-phosphate uridylyltransferase
LPELRYDIALGVYSIIATERARRPSDFKAAQQGETSSVELDPKCPFCPGNESMTPPETAAIREGGEKDTSGWSVRVVPNKFPALNDPTQLDENQLSSALTMLSRQVADDATSMYWQAPGLGGHEVLVESPKHNGNLGSYTPEHMKTVLQVIQDRMSAMASRPGVKYVQVFRNYGKSAGASLVHPHFQIIALPIMPPAVEAEMLRIERYEEENGHCLICDVVEREIEKQERVVSEDEYFAVVAPFASRYSFETMVIPRRHSTSFMEVSEEELEHLAQTLVDLFSSYQSLFASLPYNLVLHTTSTERKNGDPSAYHWHFHVYPRLNYEAGLELGTGVHINPTPPESATSDLQGR